MVCKTMRPERRMCHKQVHCLFLWLQFVRCNRHEDAERVFETAKCSAKLMKFSLRHHSLVILEPEHLKLNCIVVDDDGKSSRREGREDSRKNSWMKK
jgi:hypothetical protein